MLRASRKSGGCCDSSRGLWDGEWGRARLRTPTGNRTALRCRARDVHLRHCCTEIQQVVAVLKTERIFSMSENTRFSASDKLFNRRAGMAKLPAAADTVTFWTYFM